MADRVSNEIAHLSRFKAVLDNDSALPIRFDIQRLSLDHRQFKLTIRGIQSLAINSSGNSPTAANVFTLLVNLSSGYPFTSMPDIKFQGVIPFHPHIFVDGRICWGTNNTPQPDLVLVDWVRGVVEYLQYNQDRGSLLRMNPSSPANRVALEWWNTNRLFISHYVPTIDMARLLSWVNRTRG